jgi:hypothetical protein
VVAGPAGPGEPIAHVWTGDGVTVVFSLLDVDIHASNVWPGVVNVDGVNYPLWGPGEAPGGDGIEWDWSLNDGTLSFLGTSAAIATAATTITLTYTPLYPFTVTRTDTGDVATRGPFTSSFTQAEILSYAEAVAYGDAIIRSRKTPSYKEVTVTTSSGPAYPGESIALSFAARVVNGVYMITAVDAFNDDDGSLRYTLTCVSGTEVGATWLDFWKGATSGGGSGSGAIVVTGGTTSTITYSSPIHLGGSHSNAKDPNPAAWVDVAEGIPFVADAAATLQLRVYAWARSGTVTVRLYDVTATAAVAGSTSAGIAANSFAASTPFIATIATVAGHEYRLQVLNSVGGAAVFAFGSLKEV